MRSDSLFDMYRHRQSAGILLLAPLLRVLLCGWRAWRIGIWWLYLVGGGCPLIAWIFLLLTIEVNAQELVSWFGLGVWRHHVKLTDVIGVGRTHSSWLEGWGVPFTMRGMLYNVGGTDAVEIRLANGNRFRLGTDDPIALVTALQRHLALRTAS